MRKITRRSIVAGAGAAAAHVMFSRTMYGTVLSAEADHGPIAAPGALNLTLTAITAHTLRIGIAPATAQPLDHELGAAIEQWPGPLDAPGPARAHTAPWGAYTVRVSEHPLRVAVLQNGVVRQEISFAPNSTDVHIPLNGPVFGLGEGVHPFDRRGTRDIMTNGQISPDLGTFGARLPIPWLLSPDGWGVFVGQPQGSFDLTQDLCSFRGAEATSTRNVFLMIGEGPAQVLEEYAHLTGMPHMPPRWTLGYQQSHRTLASTEEVVGITKTFREKKLPCDAVIYLGTGFCPSGWNTGHGAFTFNKDVFSDPAAIFKAIHDDHFKVIVHVVPPGDFHGKVSDTGGAAQESGDAAAYWQQHAAIEPLGIDGWWPDEGDKLSVYERLDRNRMYFEGSRKLHADVRPFALHRNGYAGLQRYGWLWSGDTFSTWAALRAQIMVGINISLCGIPYWGTDTGGFVPTPELTPELYVRWFQWSAFCPSFRSHGRAWKLRLPWGWNTGDPGPKEVEGNWVAAWPPAEDLHRPDVETICRKFLELRYQLLPYLYSSVFQTHLTGIPLIRALCLAYPRDQSAILIDDAYLWGDNFLVAPIHQKGNTTREVYLPKGEWFSYWNNEKMQGGSTVTAEAPLDTMPLFVKAGAIVPMTPVIQHTGDFDRNAVTLRVYPGANGHFSWYDDDGTSYRYESGAFMQIDCSWNDTLRALTLALNPEGHMQPPKSVMVQLAGSPARRVILTTSTTTVVF